MNDGNGFLEILNRKDDYIIELHTKINDLETKNAILEGHNNYLKGKLEVVENIQTSIKKMESVAEEMYTYTPLLSYISDVTNSVFKLIPYTLRNELPEPRFNNILKTEDINV